MQQVATTLDQSQSDAHRRANESTESSTLGAHGSAPGSISQSMVTAWEYDTMTSNTDIQNASTMAAPNRSVTTSPIDGPRNVGTPVFSASIPGRTTSLLPADDGMALLRQQMHQIWDMALSTEEKARMMHQVLTAEYHKFKIKQSAAESLQARTQHEARGRSLSNRSISSSTTRLQSLSPSFGTLSEEAREPTYCPRPNLSVDRDDLDDGEITDEGPPLGCQHYMRNVKVQCPDCERFYTCPYCHDGVEDHRLIRKNIRNMLCMQCGHPQRASDYCRQCGELTSCYYCEICKLWENDPDKSIYHCPECGICRQGEGLGKDYIHCTKCNVCVSIQHAQNHRCVERATDCDCPICGDYMFSSSAAVVAMKCGHYIHRSCYDELMNTTYKCPICNRSAVNMELQWRKMDECLESQPMPSPYLTTKAWIICNDCTMRSCVPFHWLGNKCRMCDSYNTSQVRLVDEPVEHLQGLEARQHRAAETAGMPHPSNGSLTGNRFWPHNVAVDEAEQRQGVVNPAGDLAPSVDDHDYDRGHGSSQAPRVSLGRDLHSGAGIVAPPSPLDPRQYDVGPRTRRHSESSVSAPASTNSEVEDENNFWGEGINPSDYMPHMPSIPRMPNLPRMPSMSLPSMPHGWRSPRLFARADDEEIPESDSAQRSWRIDPRQWRLGSPTELFRPSTPSAGDAVSDGELAVESDVQNEMDGGFASRIGWDPRHWRLPGSPTLFTDSAEKEASAASPDANSGWAIDPRQWRLTGPGLFGRSRSVDTAILHSQTDADVRQGTSPSSIWDIHPREYLARRFGSFSIHSTSDTGDSDRSGDYGSDDNDDSDDGSEEEIEDGEVDDDTASVDGEGDMDELDLIGHR